MRERVWIYFERSGRWIEGTAEGVRAAERRGRPVRRSRGRPRRRPEAFAGESPAGEPAGLWRLA